MEDITKPIYKPYSLSVRLRAKLKNVNFARNYLLLEQDSENFNTRTAVFINSDIKYARPSGKIITLLQEALNKPDEVYDFIIDIKKSKNKLSDEYNWYLTITEQNIEIALRHVV